MSSLGDDKFFCRRLNRVVGVQECAQSFYEETWMTARERAKAGVMTFSPCRKCGLGSVNRLAIGLGRRPSKEDWMEVYGEEKNISWPYTQQAGEPVVKRRRKRKAVEKVPEVTVRVELKVNTSGSSLKNLLTGVQRTSPKPKRKP